MRDTLRNRSAGGSLKDSTWPFFLKHGVFKGPISKEKNGDFAKRTTQLDQFAVPEKKRAKMKSSAVEKLLEIEEKKLLAYQQRKSNPSDEDADFHFLMSLLPYLRKVPEQRKMLVWTKLQQIFCEEELHGEHRAQHVSSGYTHAAGGSSNQSWKSGSTLTVTPQNTPERTSLRILLIQLIEN
ncbi:hypothetical protein J437_LFUL015152 [Ladona fulva]|uniref:BESS domain-containing protein n=1 Tax=Ladona fulva TaxID=123851 RepID=A0A8K0KI48_LADFU|nr:hypothetical protein J437_LFUL015152 [Ladona fulva]